VSSDDRTGRPLVRLVVAPLALFVAVAGATFALAKLHLAKPGSPPPAQASAHVAVGDARRGEAIFRDSCAGCHGSGGEGGIGPRLVGDRISLARAEAQIDAGGGAMPPGLVKGRDERDVLAYVATLIAPPE
jgi:cytochrome c551